MRFMRAHQAGIWTGVALVGMGVGCASTAGDARGPTSPTPEPQLAYAPKSGGVATEASYKRDQNSGPKDDIAEKKIEDAVNSLYLAGKMRDAEAQLKGVYEACGDDCSPRIKAKAWMYIGIVWGSGNNDQEKAREAFQYALELDPTTRLDVSLATPETKKVFDEEKSAAAATTLPTGAGASRTTTPPPAGVPPAVPAPAATHTSEPGVPLVPPPPPATR